MASLIFSQLGIDQLEWLKAWVLIPLYVTSTVVVIFGVYLERDKFPKESQDIGWRMLLIALAAETLWGILIFSADGQISSLQRGTIKTLEARLVVLESPRTFSPSPQFASVGKRYLVGKEFDLAAENEFEPMKLALAIRPQLLTIGMIERLSNAANHWSPPNGGLPIGEIIRPGIAVRSCDNKIAEPNRPTPARILGALLSDSGLGSKEAPIFIEPADADDCAKAPDVLHVEVGQKIVMPWTPPPGTVVVYPKLQLEVAK